MNKYKKPLRNTHDELFDVDWLWEKKQQVKEAYAAFWETLDAEVALDLDMLLL